MAQVSNDKQAIKVGIVDRRKFGVGEVIFSGSTSVGERYVSAQAFVFFHAEEPTTFVFRAGGQVSTAAQARALAQCLTALVRAVEKWEKKK